MNHKPAVHSSIKRWAAFSTESLLGTLMPTSAARVGLAALLVAATAVTGCQTPADELVVYSARNEQLIQPLFERYTQETGIPIRFLTDDAGVLLEKLKAEGENTPADILITVDAGNLWQATEADLLRPIDSAVLAANIPPHLRDPDGRWFGLSLRARTLVYSTERVSPEALSTYEALADTQWAGRLCLRTSRKVYNQSLVASFINRMGEEQTEQFIRGWVRNLATDVFSNDTQLMEAILAGQCDVGIVNTYYFGRLQAERPDLPLALYWPNQDGDGVHVNVSGAGVTRHAKHPEAARAFLEWLSMGEAQAVFAAANREYPANPSIAADEQVSAWGDFKQSTMPLTRAGQLQPAAVKLMDRAGYQ